MFQDNQGRKWDVLALPWPYTIFCGRLSQVHTPFKKLVTFKSVYMAYLKNQLDHFQLEFIAIKPIPFYTKIVQKIKIMQFSIWPVSILNQWIYQECLRHL